LEQIVAPTSLDEVLRFPSANDADQFADAIDFQDREDLLPGAFRVRRSRRPSAEVADLES
jgi:hypothetical protein